MVRIILILALCFATSVPALAQSKSGGAGKVSLSGMLRRNPGAKNGQAPFSIVDEEGNAVGHIRPERGVRLDHLVGTNVEIAGDDVSDGSSGVPELAIGAIEGDSAAEMPETTPADDQGAPIVNRTAFEDQPRRRSEELPPAPVPQAAPVVAQEEIMEGPISGDPPAPAHHNHGMLGEDHCDSCNDWGCDRCGHGGGGILSGLYVRGEWIHWRSRGMWTPALVTTSPAGTDRADAGVMGLPDTTVLFGNKGINNGPSSGARITMGYWLGGCRQTAIEGDYFHLGEIKDRYQNTSFGEPILMRPFYDILQGTESAEIVAFPGTLVGTITIDPITRFQGAGLRKRVNLCCNEACDPCFGISGWRNDMTLGYRYLRLDDKLTIREDLMSDDPLNPGSFVVRDQFTSLNVFNGMELGWVTERRHGPWSLEFLARMGVGRTAGRVRINGSTDIIQNGVVDQQVGGLLAQRTNIGVYDRQTLGTINEFGTTVGFQFNSIWRATFGTTFMYWSNVARAGEQIDRDVNPNLIPPEVVPFAGPLRPAFHWRDTDYYVIGFNLGLEGRW